MNVEEAKRLLVKVNTAWVAAAAIDSDQAREIGGSWSLNTVKASLETLYGNVLDVYGKAVVAEHLAEQKAEIVETAS